jgi:hypothetical protein
MRKHINIFLFYWLLALPMLVAQQRIYEVYSVAFYNVENLFDVEDDPNNRGDDEFLPEGPYNWTREKYEKKLDNLAEVISQLGREYSPLGPAAIGVSEVENRKVLEDLVKRPAIAEMGLEIIHEDSPDRRGIDVAMLYNPRLFSPEGYRLIPFVGEDTGYVSRDQLLVSGRLAGERLHLMVGHWPSRYGGDKSSPLRESAAAIAKAVSDSLCEAEGGMSKLLIMGDLNDDPTNRSVRKVLNARKHINEVDRCGLYNPMWRLYEQGIGSLAYQGKWSLFDQIIVSHGLLQDPSQLRYWKAEVFNRSFLIQQEGRNRGYPHRTFSNNTFIDGYSDHLPVLVYLIREQQ